jgi:hypothetical protein
MEARAKARVGVWPTPDATDTDAASSAAQRLLAICKEFCFMTNLSRLGRCTCRFLMSKRDHFFSIKWP